ncbi:MAG: hypothetical protein FWH37_09645 [Candidatus Bathyarchaeota archaeon]|nr:hypothetical protein [Candidatus Termiticorpusculum sp.]
MAIEQFIVQSATLTGLRIVVIALIVSGVVLLATNLLRYNQLANRLKHNRRVGGFSLGLKSKYSLAVWGILLIVIGCFLHMTSTATSSVVTVSPGYININPLAFSGNRTVTSEEIATAFVGQLGSGNFTLHKQYGVDVGETNMGVFTLGNGAKAYVASTNSTSLIIELTSGEYIIVGNQDTQTIANSFSQNVHKLVS